MADQQTLTVYDQQVEKYQEAFRQDGVPHDLTRLTELVPPPARLLDLGCGPGDHSAWFRDRGYAVDPVDASSGMVDAARRDHGLSARVAGFDDLDATDEYHVVWASFSLLHAPRTDFPRHLSSIYRALKPEGLLFLGLKEGEGERRDAIGRFYTFYREIELEDALVASGFTKIESRTGKGVGLAGTVDPWIALFARSDKKPGA